MENLAAGMEIVAREYHATIRFPFAMVANMIA